MHTSVYALTTAPGWLQNDICVTPSASAAQPFEKLEWRKSTDVFQNPSGHSDCYQQLGKLSHGNITADSNAEVKKRLGPELSCQHSSKKCYFNKEHKCRCYFWEEQNPSPPILYMQLEFSTISPMTNEVICLCDFCYCIDIPKRKNIGQAEVPLAPRPLPDCHHLVSTCGGRSTVRGGLCATQSSGVLESGSSWEAQGGEPFACAF